VNAPDAMKIARNKKAAAILLQYSIRNLQLTQNYFIENGCGLKGRILNSAKKLALHPKEKSLKFQQRKILPKSPGIR